MRCIFEISENRRGKIEGKKAEGDIWKKGGREGKENDDY